MTANEEASDFDYGTEPDIGVERFKSVKRGVSASPKPKKKIIPNKKTAMEQTAIFDYDAHLAMHAKGHKPI